MPQQLTFEITDPKSTEEIWKSVSNSGSDLVLGIGNVTVKATGTATITLPPSAGNLDRLINVKNLGTGLITVVGDSSDTIDGATQIFLSVQYTAVTLQCDGAGNWDII